MTRNIARLLERQDKEYERYLEANNNPDADYVRYYDQETGTVSYELLEIVDETGIAVRN